MANYSSSANATTKVPLARTYGSNWAFGAYSGTFSASISDQIEMVRLPRNAVVEQIVVGGTVAATAASLLVGDSASKSRYGTVSLSSAASAQPWVNVTGVDYHYSLSDDVGAVSILLTASANTSASGSASIHMGVWYHMPDGR